MDIVEERLRHFYNLHTKLTGAGGGGCALTFIPEFIIRENLLPNIMNAVKDISEFKYDCFTTTICAEGVRCETE